jgi:aspartate-semialdehyde dehydrogenase
MKLHDIAVVGASGLVGRKILQVLEERNFPAGKIVAIASEASHGKEIAVSKRTYKLQKMTHDTFKNLEFAFFSAGGHVSLEYVPKAVKDGLTVIDNSSAFRMNDDVPLVVPEVNRPDIFKNKGIIANPNCSTIQLVMVLKPLDDRFKLKRVVVSTYQSVAGAGNKGVMQLEKELHKAEGVHTKSVFPHPIAYNALPQIDIFFDNGYTKEELKVIDETKKILGRSDLKITSTCVRVPTIGGHSESVNLEFENKFSLHEIREILSNTKGVKVIDEPKESKYPMPIDSYDRDEVFVGRIRTDDTVKHGLNLWIVSDSVRKGAATNAVQIAEELLKGK